MSVCSLACSKAGGSSCTVATLNSLSRSRRQLGLSSFPLLRPEEHNRHRIAKKMEVTRAGNGVLRQGRLELVADALDVGGVRSGRGVGLGCGQDRLALLGGRFNSAQVLEREARIQ